ncbi:GntR family transcriptional regulator [Corynebacterium doosanense]|uniref:GntR family transcriptional regulator n=1 Tax=Corynebacterium doosanense CAU 212 = DSM 45436 TaxID=558173 RepID=A0A097IIV0_9CORY|nr:GntR family transcriptional regulator [Corynebacterium doosanense]AIT62054.1 GntR family transcriptional regulator [Corynebacterium doosanense CAU 212 = DSM 45436]
MNNEQEPLYRQIATLIEDMLVDGTLLEGDRAPSTNELAAFHAVNPATARRGLGLLVDGGVLHRRRGVGMFVSPGALELVRHRRRGVFASGLVAPLIDEALRLNVGRAELHDLVDRVAESRGMYR